MRVSFPFLASHVPASVNAIPSQSMWEYPSHRRLCAHSVFALEKLLNLCHLFPGCVMWDCIVGEGFQRRGHDLLLSSLLSPFPYFLLTAFLPVGPLLKLAYRVRICGAGGGSACALQFILLLLFLKGTGYGRQLPQHKMYICCIPHQALLPAGPQFPHL